VFGIEIRHPSGRVILKRPGVLATSIDYCRGFASGYGDHLVCFVEGLLSDLAGFALGLDARGSEELFGFGEQGIVGLGRFLEHQPGGFFSSLVELLIQGGSELAITIELLRRLRLLVGGFLQRTLKLGDVFFGSRHLLVKLVEAVINLTRDRVPIDQAEWGLIW
jgi:hypothetical protein